MDRTVLALRHVAFEDLGALGPLLRERGFDVRWWDAGIDPPALLHRAAGHDLVVVLGGPIGAFEEAEYPFLRDELALIGARLRDARPTLGICLGAQLMARALGAGVRPMGHKEIGFLPLALTDDGRRSPLAPLETAPGAPTAPVLHWHGDQFDVPAGARCLASSPLCPHQAFALGTHALGLQFHLEAEAEAIGRWVVGHAVELAAAGLSPSRLREDAQRHGAAMRSLAAEVFSGWLDLAFDASAR